MAGFTEFFDYSVKQNRRIEKVLKEIKDKQKEYEQISLEEFPQFTESLKERLRGGETLDDILVEAYAGICEAFKKIQQKNFPNDKTRKGYYDEQIKTSLVLSNGDLAQMLTGEGKTYALTLSAYLSALKEEGVHIITSNEYLAERDYKDNKELFEVMGLTTSFVGQEDSKEKKKSGYACDITYTTPTTVAFDYLRDNMANSKEEQVMRGLSTCILDEVDSSLIDEANNPYIISTNDAVPEKIYHDINYIVSRLNGKVIDAGFDQVYEDAIELEDDTRYLDFIGSKKDATIFLTDVGIEKVNRRLKEMGYENQIQSMNGETVQIEPQAYMNGYTVNALVANFLMQDKNDYLVQDDKVKVINRETGRIAVGSSFGKGLHQAIEAKERLSITDNTMTLTTINQPNLFKLYSSFSGLSGTLLSAKKEFRELYHKEIVSIEPRKGMHRKDEEPTICQTETEKYNLILQEVKEASKKGQPILIGTESIFESERVSLFLKENHITHNLLNASNPHEEAEIIAKAGEVGAITVTTNIAGRGTDIKPSEEALAKGGLYIIGASLSESERIDDQLKGRSGRQGNVGKSKFIISLEDSIFQKNYIPSKLAQFKNFVKRKTQKELQTIVKKFQKRIELDAFAGRKQRNEIESIDAFFRENFDKENEMIRSSKHVETIFLSMLEAKLQKDMKKENFKEKYKSFGNYENANELAQHIKDTFCKRLKEVELETGYDAFSYKLKKSMIDASSKGWIAFINNADNRKMQAQMNGTYKQSDVLQEYLNISHEEWDVQMAVVQDSIIQNVIDHFEIELKKQEEKEETSKKQKKEDRLNEKKPVVTRDMIINEISDMLFHKEDPQKIIHMENLLQLNKNALPSIDVQIIESSIIVAKRSYIKMLKNKITHAVSLEDLTAIESSICDTVIPPEEGEIIQSLLNEVKENVSSEKRSLKNAL